MTQFLIKRLPIFFFKPFSDYNVKLQFGTETSASVFGLIEVARAFDSEIGPYTLFSAALKYLFLDRYDIR